MLLAFFDITIIGLMLAMGWLMLRGNKGNPVSLGRKARFLPATGLGLIGLFYAVELASFTGLPLLWGDQRTIAFMNDFYLNWSWPLILIAVSLIAIGYLCSVREAREAIEKLETAEQESQFIRQRMKDFAESTSDWFWETDENLRYNWFSANVESVTGVPRSAHYGKTREELGALEGSSVPWREHLETLKAHKPFRDFIFKSKALEGDKWLRATGIPIFDASGRFTGYRGTGSDVTREIEAKIASEEARSLLARAVQGLAETFALWGPDDRLVICNDKFREVNAATMTVTEPGTLFSDHIRTLLGHGAYPEAVGQEEVWYRERLAHHKNPRGPRELARRDGMWLLIDEQRLDDGSTVTISLDITKRKRAELALQESETLLESVIENVPFGLPIKSTDHIVERANSTYLNWYGLDAETLLGRRSESVENFQPESDTAYMNSQEREVLASGEIRTRQVDRIFADGNTHTLKITKFPVHDLDRNIIKVGSISVDLTEQVRAQNALLRSESQYRDFAETASDWTWEMDRQLRFTAISDRYREITGSNPSIFLGNTRRDMTPEDINDEKWRRHHSDLDNRRAFRDFRYDVSRPIGPTLTVSISGKPVFDENGEFDGYRGTGTNITEQRRIEKARDAALQEALNANAAKSKFLANMSHDLRTPLNAILGFSDIMREQMLGPIGEDKYLEYSNDIHTSASYLLELVNDLLDISTIEAGKKLLTKEDLNVGDLIHDCVRTFVGKAYSKDVELVTTVPASLPNLHADKRATRQILVNLLTNAVKFTPSGGMVTASAGKRDKYIEIVVKDTGPGIAPDRLVEVTNPFNRGEHHPYETDTGWGLGLSIVQSLVDLHDGKMEIVSQPGEGTVVTVSLPNGGETRIEGTSQNTERSIRARILA
jgi:PAS domain S-box-containing protein